jgi:hypothetical protein
VSLSCSWRGFLAMASFAAVLPLWTPAGNAQDEGAALLERRVKSALLYRFINYFEWPAGSFPEPGTPFTIGIVGADARAGELEEFAAGRTVLNRPLAVRRFRPADTAFPAHLVFVGAQESAALGRIARAAPAYAVIVSETEDGLRQGAVINFVIVNGQVRFDISLEAARKRNLRVSSRLLAVAHSVQGN